MTRETAQTLADFYRKNLQFRKEIMTCEMELEGSISYRVGDLVGVGGSDLISSDVLSSRVISSSVDNSITTLKLDNIGIFDENKKYKIKVRKLNGNIVMVDGEFNIIKSNINDFKKQFIEVNGKAVSFDRKNVEGNFKNESAEQELCVGDDRLVVNSNVIVVDPILLSSQVLIKTPSTLNIEKDDLILLSQVGTDIKNYVITKIEAQPDLSANVSMLEYSSNVFD